MLKTPGTLELALGFRSFGGEVPRPSTAESTLVSGASVDMFVMVEVYRKLEQRPDTR
jgi:hypothetical protein